eukprot:SAG11_NODE_128_length_15542_cov_6.432105_8_plen_450_part_00
MPATLAILAMVGVLTRSTSMSEAGGAAPAVLRNAELSAQLDPTQGLLRISVIGAGRGPTTDHGFVPGTDGWQVRVSDLNSTAGAATLGNDGGSCELARFAPDPSSQAATYSYACDPAGYVVEVKYELRDGWKFLKKSVRVRKDSQAEAAHAAVPAPWEGTVRSVTHWTGLDPLGGYTGRAVANPVSGPASFHPKASASESELTAAAGGPKGPLQPTLIAGLWRRSTAADGLFASVMNPFGVYGNATSNASADIETTAAVAPSWDVRVGRTCGGAKYDFKSNVSSVAACKARCAADTPRCVAFEWKNSVDPKSTHWCTLFNASAFTGRLGTNKEYDCGCRGQCPVAPSPPAPHPHPPHPHPPGPPGPAPPPAPVITLPPTIHARFEPIFLQTTRHPVWYEAEAAVLGVTALERYDIDSVSGVNIGEWRAFTEAVTVRTRACGYLRAAAIR